jgi:hypothetical protein
MQNDDAGREQPPQAFPCEYVVVQVADLEYMFEDIKRPWPDSAIRLWVKLYRARHQHEYWSTGPNPSILAGMAGISRSRAEDYISDSEGTRLMSVAAPKPEFR